MFLKKIAIISLSIVAAIIFSACVGAPINPSAAPGDFVYRGHDFGPDRNSVYRRGVMDGCKTVDGIYTKDHGLYNDSEDYHNGWEHGRLHCKGR
jgi:hypothetical protein